MHHEVLGDISYNKDIPAWTGWCALPVFAEYGRLAPDNHMLSEASSEFNRGLFQLEIQDDTGNGPTQQQANAIRYLHEHEADVCRAVMMQLVEVCDMKGGPIAWLQQRRESRWWGWLARVVGPEYKAPEDMKQAVRCTEVEVSAAFAGDYAYVAFYFETIFATEVEHGLSVVFHPEKEPLCGDRSAICEFT